MTKNENKTDPESLSIDDLEKALDTLPPLRKAKRFKCIAVIEVADDGSEVHVHNAFTEQEPHSEVLEPQCGDGVKITVRRKKFDKPVVITVLTATDNTMQDPNIPHFLKFRLGRCHKCKSIFTKQHATDRFCSMKCSDDFDEGKEIPI